MQSLSIVFFSLAKNRSLESCAFSEAFPNTVFKTIARNKVPDCFVKVVCASFSSPSPKHIVTNTQVFLYTKLGIWKACFCVDFVCLQVCHPSSQDEENQPVKETPSLLTAQEHFPGMASAHVPL